MGIINRELLLKFINETGVSYSELARQSDISRNTVDNMKNGSTIPSIEIINCLFNSGLLNITQDDFMATFFPNITFEK